jgi:hypothetical protein
MPKTSSPARRKDQNQVQIGIFSMAALVDPPMPLLDSHLSYRRKRFEQGGKTGYRGHEEDFVLWQFDHRGRMAVPVGLLPRVLRILAENGYQVTLTDHRTFGKKFQLDMKFAESLEAEDRTLVEAVRQNPMGQIEVKNFAAMIERMRLIVSLYPQAHVLIPVATRKTAWKVRDQLYNEDAGWGVHRLEAKEGWPREPYRCMVCTFLSLLTCHTEDWEIVLLPDPLGATGDRKARYSSRLNVVTPAKSSNSCLCGRTSPRYVPSGVLPVASPRTHVGRRLTRSAMILVAQSLIATSSLAINSRML